jgi:hypothetical protein
MLMAASKPWQNFGRDFGAGGSCEGFGHDR